MLTSAITIRTAIKFSHSLANPRARGVLKYVDHSIETMSMIHTPKVNLQNPLCGLRCICTYLLAGDCSPYWSI